MGEHHESAARIAIVGMAGRFPGAADVDAFWRNLRDGVDCITHFSADALRAAGVPEAALRDPAYVPARGVLADADRFDAARFGVGAREAECIDPQHRVFLECALAALEDAGRGERSPAQLVGLFAGAGASDYAGSSGAARAAGDFALALGGEKDFLATRVAHRLDLRGPCMTVQTACSTALVAVSLACQSLLAYQCDVALAGAVAIGLPLGAGYQHRPGMVFAPDGTCRPFAADAAGTVPGDGVGVVVLRRLEDALADGDTVLATICGFGVTNDGAARQSFAAPGVEGQATAIAQALAMAGFEPASVSYVEAHGTGTALGDPIEVAALARAFAGDPRSGACGLGSVKANIGHLDAAAGIAGLIKAVQMLRHKELPPSLHVARVNPRLDLESTPFCVLTERRAWHASGPRRIGVSAFGIGGTNAHVVLEEPPPPAPSHPAAGSQVLALSAASEPALAGLTAALAHHFAEHPEQPLADVAFTLQAGRRALRYRRAVVCDDHAAAIAGLSAAATDVADDAAEVVFLFPGHGAGYPAMGRALYDAWPSFRADLDEGLALLRSRAGLDLRPVLFPPAHTTARADASLAHGVLGQPAVFLVEWALGRLLLDWGVSPRAMLGHSLGEYAAACLAGVLSLADALTLVAARGRLIAGTPAGAMLAVSLAPEDLEPWLGAQLELAVINGPAQCVVAGPPAAVDALARTLAGRGVSTRRLAAPHAFHSRAMDAIVPPFIAAARRVALHAPQIPLISSCTGEPLGADEATDPAYWGRHLRAPVRFDAALRRCAGRSRVLLEVGPGDTLTTLTRRHPDLAVRDALSTLGRASESDGEPPLLRSLARLWQLGAPIALQRLHLAPRQRVRLPTCVFDRRRYWRSAPPPPPTPVPSPGRDVGAWFHRPVWRAAPWTSPPTVAAGEYLIFTDLAALASALQTALPGRVTLVRSGDRFAPAGPGAYTLRPGEPADYAALLDALADRPPDHVLHLWGVDAGERTLAAAIDRGLLGVVRLLRALHREPSQRPLRLLVATCGAQAADAPVERPEQAMGLALARVVPDEYPHVRCGVVDLARADLTPSAMPRLAAALLHELAALTRGPSVALALRGERRLALGFEPQHIEPSATVTPPGPWLVTGGLGGIGLVLARRLAAIRGARIALLGRTGLPPRALWPEILRADPSPGPDDLAFRVRAVEELERAGAEVLVLAADVTSAADMQRALAELRARFGRLGGVVHAAGVASGGVVQRQSDAELLAALAAKVDGSLLLAEQTRDDPLTSFVLCSSLTAIGGGFGQLAYCAANCFLDALALHLRGRGVPAQALAWDGWSEVGMAARRGTPGEASHPLLGATLLRAPALGLHRRRLDPARDWVFTEHRLHGRPTLPGTALVELAWAAASTRLGDGPLRLRDLTLAAPLDADEADALELWTITRPLAGGCAVEIHSRRLGAPTSRVHLHGVAATAPPRPAPASLAPLFEGCDARDPDSLFVAHGGLEFGARWRCVRRLWVGPHHAVVELDAPEHDGDHPLHPAVLDMAAGCAAHLVADARLPSSYGEIRVHGALRGRLVACARLVAHGPRATRFAVTVYDAHGAVLVEIDDYCLTAVRPAEVAEELP
jgi:acyl transferase domain-containing protein